MTEKCDVVNTGGALNPMYCRTHDRHLSLLDDGRWVCPDAVVAEKDALEAEVEQLRAAIRDFVKVFADWPIAYQEPHDALGTAYRDFKALVGKWDKEGKA